VILVNAASVRNLPGRKTDVSDAVWLADLGAHGLVKASFSDDQSKLTLSENKAGTDVDGLADVEGPADAPKNRQRVELNVFKLNPLDQNNKDGDNAAQISDDGGTTTTVKHRPGINITPFRDLVRRVLGGLDNDNDGGAAADADEKSPATTP
jgi:hypothetical protein